MELSELIDLETQLHRDERARHEGEGEKTLARDRAIGGELLRDMAVEPAQARRRLEQEAGFRHELAAGWLSRVRKGVALLPGTRIARGYRLIGGLLTVLAVVLGCSTAMVALAYDGSEPVNVFRFIGVLVLFQILLLIALFVVAIFRQGAAGWLNDRVDWISRSRWVDRWLGASADDGRGDLEALRARGHLYGGVFQWTLFSLTQRFGVVFNITALVTCLLVVTFTDIAFSWSTTWDVDAEDVRVLVDGIALPWSWWLPEAVPSVDVIRDTEWIRQGGTGFRGDEVDLERLKTWAGAWSRFLFAALLCWGLLPRLLLWALGRWKARRALSGAGLDHAEFQRLFERLVPLEGGWSGPAAQDVGRRGEPAPGAARSGGARDALEGLVDRSVGVIAWGRLALHQAAMGELAAGRYASTRQTVVSAGGADLAEDDRAVAALADAAPVVVVLVVETGVQPTKEILALLRSLRSALGARARLVISLVRSDGDDWGEADAAELQAWSGTIAREGDPYLSIETLVAA